jgi:hypothetical protein
VLGSDLERSSDGTATAQQFERTLLHEVQVGECVARVNEFTHVRLTAVNNSRDDVLGKLLMIRSYWWFALKRLARTRYYTGRSDTN